ncbi:hypothetical protein SAMN05192575_11162 [Nocardioides alpinus]|uniref:DUF1269 domain-containing protein n=1 Tax=Nocardioides alpinus TaxID=748909 RepID=A0A1I1AXD4_9ACTN|nr:DUF6325 family protein [Nocardioides alpinus]PKH40934.1 hypothetical protein CXG46_10770 [Nocardioides alpinus]SFB42172.1 hypothetical protein SAMN05192575_11162 [Nocardioides alpinus]
MTLGPIEVVVIAFPGNQFNGRILPELGRLLDAGTVSIVDGLLISKDAAGNTTFVEIDDDGLGEDVARLAHLFDRFDELISDEDVEELAADLDPDSSAAVLVFEHTWVRPLRDAIVDSGGVLAANFRVPREVVDEVMTALETAS